MAAEEIKVELELGKETKNKRRYEEVGYEDVLGTIYVSKRAMAQLDFPVNIEITIRKVS